MSSTSENMDNQTVKSELGIAGSLNKKENENDKTFESSITEETLHLETKESSVLFKEVKDGPVYELTGNFERYLQERRTVKKRDVIIVEEQMTFIEKMEAKRLKEISEEQNKTLSEDIKCGDKTDEREVGCSGNTVNLSLTRRHEGSIHPSSRCNSEVEKTFTSDNKTIRDLNQKLPFDDLLILFSYLSTEDLVSSQRVCHEWRMTAHYKSLWKHFTLYLVGTREDEKKVRIMPALRNISGVANNNLINIILENVTELSTMNIEFKPPLSLQQILIVQEKYPELKSIKLDLSAPDIIESVQMLGRCQQLTHLNLFATNYDSSDCVTNLLNIYTIIADEENYPALAHLDNTYFLTAARDQTLVNVFIDIIKKKSRRLSSLKVEVCDTEYENLINAINMCTELCRLHLTLSVEHTCQHFIFLDIERMTRLTFLHLSIQMCSYLLTFYGSVCNGSWSHLTELDLTIASSDQPNLNILSAVIENMKQLLYLGLLDKDCNISERELRHIGSLPKLKGFGINGFTRLSMEGINYIKECKNLTYLMLAVGEFNIGKRNVCIVNMLQQIKKVDSLFLKEKGGWYVYLMSKEMINEFVSINQADLT